MRLRRVALVGGLAGVLALGILPLSSVTAAPRADLEQVEQQVRELQMSAEAAHERARGAKNRLAEIQGNLDSIKKRASRERDDLQSVVSTIGDIARATYSSGGLDPGLQVLMAEDPTEFLAQAAVMGQLEQTQVAQLRKARTTKLRLAQTEAEIADQEAAAAALTAEMAEAQAEVDAQLAEAEQVLSQLEEAERQRLEELARERREQALAEAAAAAAALAEQQAQQQAQQNQGPSTDNGDSGSTSTGGSDSADTGSADPGSQASADGGGFSGGTRAAVAIQSALAQVGEPYSYSASPPSSWDCSKLTAWAWAQAGVSLTALSYTQWDQTRRVPVEEIQPGDLVFYFGGGAHHVGMYIGNGKMVHAANPTDDVEVADFLGPWYRERFSGVGRVIG